MTVRWMLAPVALACAALHAFQGGTVLELIKQSHDGQVKLSAKNVSGGPITGYVVEVRSRDGRKSQVLMARYTGDDVMPSGQTIPLTSFKESEATSLQISVDCVQLTGGRIVGECRTEQSKELTARAPK